MAAPEVPGSLTYSELSGYAVRALGALQEANVRNKAVLDVVDGYNEQIQGGLTEGP